MKWNLRWVAARQDIWRPAQLLTAFQAVGFAPSLSKVAALWSGKPISLRLDDLDMICAALGCTVADLLEAEPLAGTAPLEGERPKAVGAEHDGAPAGPTGRVGPPRPVPRPGGVQRRALPPN